MGRFNTGIMEKVRYKFSRLQDISKNKGSKNGKKQAGEKQRGNPAEKKKKGGKKE